MTLSATAARSTARTELYRDRTVAGARVAHESALLVEAVRTVDNLDALAAVVTAEGVIDKGTGRAHPALVESRNLRLVLARLLASLRLPSGDEDDLSRPQRRGAVRGTYVR